MTTYLVGRLDRLIRRALEELIRDQDVSVVGYTAMSVLEARPGLSNAELARRSFVTPQGMSQTLATLTEGGLIRRTPATRNRRVQLVELTDRGRQVVEVCSRRVAGFEGELLASLTARRARGAQHDPVGDREPQPHHLSTTDGCLGDRSVPKHPSVVLAVVTGGPGVPSPSTRRRRGRPRGGPWRRGR